MQFKEFKASGVANWENCLPTIKHIGRPDGIDQYDTYTEIIDTHKRDDCIK